MALEEYNRKRDFRKTPEPSGRVRKHPAAEPLSFVVQEHAARRLHYDFRLELNGVLLSWAIPKGPSLDPGEKRLAVHVEDHPLDYGGFEGVIPKGQYGGGTVLLWDRGTWTPEGPRPEDAYKKGALKFRLDGEKLHGHWALVRMGGKAAQERHENWLLIKERDEVAAPGSDAALVDNNPLSVATGRSMDEIANDRDRVWDSEKGEIPGDPPAKAKAAKKAPFTPPAGARKRAMPERVEPQLATLVDKAPDGPEWLHEIKYDGYRLLARIEKGKARLITRNGLDWTAKFPALARAIAALPVTTAIVDGELVALAVDGTTNFADLQDRIATGRTDDLVFFAFDVLYRDGYDLTGAVLEARKAALANVVPHGSAGMIRYSDHQQGHGVEFHREACRYELEGTVAKRADKPYRAGRGNDWQKIKCLNRDEFIVVGFTDPERTRQGFGALLLGYYEPKGQLRYAGKVGTGFDTGKLLELRPRLDAIEQPKATVSLPKGVSKKGVHWTKPKLVAEVQYSRITADKILRHASFQGLREDKSAEEVMYDPEKLGKAEAASPPSPRSRRGNANPERKTHEAPSAEVAKAKPPASPSASKASIVSARDGSIEFAGVRLTHPDRVLYPDQGITKLSLAEYYAAIEKWALPHLANRPLSLVRCPEGQGKECFYQKHATPAVPKVVGRVQIPEGTGTGTGTYTYIKDLAGLIAMVQMGVLEIHPWGSTVKKLETPDIVTFDFDPDLGLPWERVAEAAVEMREALLGIGLRSFAKTTGGKGLHVVVPLTPKLGWDAIKEFAKWVAERFVKAYPDRFTSNMAKRARTGRIFIDYLRNGRGATAIGAYSARARPGATVATPLSWEEVEKGVKPDMFTVATVPARLNELKSDPWAEIGTVRQSISAKVRREIGI
jgi:bifunctional non-homologous end joining protein LigD